MTNSRARDSKGRFVSTYDNERYNWNFKFIIVTLIAVAFFAGVLIQYGYAAGYKDGHATGYALALSENRQSIFDEGFEKGIEFDGDWEILYSHWYGITTACRKSDPNACKSFDEDKNTINEWRRDDPVKVIWG